MPSISVNTAPATVVKPQPLPGNDVAKWQNQPLATLTFTQGGGQQEVTAFAGVSSRSFNQGRPVFVLAGKSFDAARELATQLARETDGPRNPPSGADTVWQNASAILQGKTGAYYVTSLVNDPSSRIGSHIRIDGTTGAMASRVFEGADSKLSDLKAIVGESTWVDFRPKS